MNYYINTKNQVFAFDLATQSEFIAPELVEVPTTYTPEQFQYLELVNGKVIFNKSASDSAIKSSSIDAYKSSAQTQLDSLAKSWGYDSLISASSYETSTNVQFKAESLVLIAWRDEVWGSAYALLANVQSGKKSAPKSVDDFLAGLPVAPDRPVA